MPLSLDRAARASLLAFVTAFVTLLTQVLVHRVVAAKLLNNYAFLVISLTMLGFAASGLVLSRSLARFQEDEGRFLGLAAALFVLTLLGATWAFYRAPAWPQFVSSRMEFLRGFCLSVPLALLYAVPFTFCGLILGYLLAAPSLRVQRIYFSDLVGSAVGAVAAIPCISLLGAERGLAAGSALLLGTTAALFRPSRSLRWSFLAALLAVGVAAWRPAAVFELRYPEGTQPLDTEYVAWDAIARIELSRFAVAGPPSDPSTRCLVGEDAAFTSGFKKVVTQNNWAGTMAFAWDGRPESLTGIEKTIYGAAYQASVVKGPKAAIIGVGAGMDVLNALHYGASEITGIEVNAATVDIVRRVYRDYFRAWSEDPRLRLVVDDGRSYLAGHPGPYDVIQISGVDSFAGTAASPHIFSENYLYTAEAFDLYLARLSQQGILNVMRFEHEVPQAMLRALVTAVAALRRTGVAEPARNIVTITTVDGRYTALLVKRNPFVAEELRGLVAWVGGSRTFRISAAPGFTPREGNLLHEFLALRDPVRERAFAAGYPFDIRPTPDDRPFYFRYSFWWHVFPNQTVVGRFVPVMEYSLLLLLGLVGAVTLVFVYLPLRWLRSGAGVTPSVGAGVYFGALGLGFMAVEISFLQRFGWFLGHPNYALSVVLATLLLAAGLGSTLSERLVAALGGVRFVGYALSAALLALHFGLAALPRAVGWPFAAKALMVAALVAPAGVLMGAFLPWGLAQLRSVAPSLVAWAWGINGIASVLGPVVSIGVSMTFGASALMLSAIPVYLAAGFASSSLKRP